MNSSKEEVDEGSPIKKNVAQEADEGSPVKKNVTQETDEGSPIKENATQEVDEGSPIKKDATQEVDGGSPVKKNATQEVDEGSPVKKNVTQEVDEGSPTKKNVTQEVDEGSPTKKNVTQEVDEGSTVKKDAKVVFVMGGPGSGKRTQCARIEQKYGYTHLLIGDLLQDEIKAGSEDGTMIQNVTNEGKPVPSDVIVRLILKAMRETDNDKFLIDGFPRNEENILTFRNLTNIEPEFVLFLDCPEDVMTKRLLSRNQDSNDDSIQTIRERFQVFQESTLPLVDYYASKEMLRKVDASREADDVFDSVKAIFSSSKEEMPLGCFNLWFLKF